MAYATLADLRQWLGILDGADDTELSLALDASQTAVSAWCGADFNVYAQTSAKVFAAANRRLLDLGSVGLSIGSQTGLAVATDEDDDGTFETVWTAGDWQVEPLNSAWPGGSSRPGDRLRAIGDYRFPVGGTGRARVQITARWGWPAVPKPVKLATLILTTAWHQRRATMTGRSGFDGFFNSAIGDDQSLQDLLAPYRAGTNIAGIA